MPDKQAFVRQALQLSPVVPVLVIQRLDDALPLGRALFEGGLKVLEVTLRTPAALAAIEALAQALPDAVVAAGTVTTPDQLTAAQHAGARLAVSPGLTDALARAAHARSLPLLPGVATASELMTAMDAGFGCFKFFPAEAAGGTAMLKSLGGPFPDALFCPTGGIGADNAASYLALPNVACVGGSWVVPEDAIKSGDWPRIRRLAEAAAVLPRMRAAPAA